jgi:hypothetical protein
MAARFANAHPSRPAHEIHKEARQAVKRQGKDMPLVSGVLREIEKVIKAPPGGGWQSSADPFDPYMVTKADLKAVATALENVKCCGVAVYEDGDYIFAAVRSALHSNELPKKADGVTRAMQLGYRRLVQLAMLKERRAAAATGGAPDNVASGAGSANAMDSQTSSVVGQDRTISARDTDNIMLSQAARISELEDENSSLRDELQRLSGVAAENDRLRDENERLARQAEEGGRVRDENERLKVAEKRLRDKIEQLKRERAESRGEAQRSSKRLHGDLDDLHAWLERTRRNNPQL